MKVLLLLYTTLIVINTFIHTIEDDVYYFGMPRYFYRGTFTSAIVKTPMVYVQWVPFDLLKQNRTTFNGLISVAHWNKWPPTRTGGINPNISTKTLKPSRFALAFIPPTDGSVYVEVAFIALDAKCLGELNDDNYTADFADNKFPYYQGNTSVRLEEPPVDEDDEEDDAFTTNVDYELLKSYIPAPVLSFLLDPNPLGN